MTPAAAPGIHRMEDPVVRRRFAATFAALFALAMAAVTSLGRPAGFFTPEELRHVSNLPVAPPQIQRRIPPAITNADLVDQVDQLEDLLRGTPAQPSPGATR